jgi:phosphate transport system substrate-binding protein
VSITDAPGPGVYPIASFTWLLLREEPSNLRQSKAMVDFARWALTDGQAFAGPLGYARLPSNVVERGLAALARVKTS